MGDNERWPNFLPRDRYGKIGAFLALPEEYSYLRGEAANGYQEALKLSRFDRHVMMLPDADSTCFLVHDILESAAPHRYEWILMTMQKAIESAEGEFKMRSGKRMLTIRLLSPTGLKGSSEQAIVTHRPMKGSAPERGFRLTLAGGAPSRNAEYLVWLALHDADAKAPATEMLEGALKIRNGRWTDILAPQGNGSSIASDGRHAAVRQEQGRLRCWAVNDAKRLSVSGREICVASVPFSAVGSLRAAGNTVTIDMKNAAELSVHAPTRPSGCKLDGKAAAFRYDAATAMLRVTVGGGRHTLEYA